MSDLTFVTFACVDNSDKSSATRCRAKGLPAPTTIQSPRVHQRDDGECRCHMLFTARGTHDTWHEHGPRRTEWWQVIRAGPIPPAPPRPSGVGVTPPVRK
eukprot:COSAG06_NODE_10180_length_1734_cov_0.965749_4_plen_100_part_00